MGSLSFVHLSLSMLYLLVTILFHAEVSASPPYCNLFDGKNMSTINIAKNTRISSIKVSDPLIISFDFILNEEQMNKGCKTEFIPAGLCCKEEGKVCNLIQFGRSHTYDYQGTTQAAGVSLPNISVIFQNNNWEWNITTKSSNTHTVITPNDQNLNWSVPIGKPSSFYMSFNHTNTEIRINSQLYSNDAANTAWNNNIGESFPFYISNVDNDQVIGNVTNICILTDSTAPTPFPTSEPTHSPTPFPSEIPTVMPPPTIYQKIKCYTETGNPGDLTVACSKDEYIITSCGIHAELSDNDVIFYKGSYIERKLTNNLGTDGICHINYNLNFIAPTNFPTNKPTSHPTSPTNTSSVTSSSPTKYPSLNPTLSPTAYPTVSNPKPQARCCAFQQEYSQAFKCRYFESTLPTHRKHEYSYATCNNQFPLLLSCGARVDETSKNGFDATSPEYIPFYGIFQSNMNTKNEYQYNPKYNYYFQLQTNTDKPIPLAPPPTPAPTTTQKTRKPTTSKTARPTEATPTQSPTRAPLQDGDKDILQLSHTNIQCVAQHGNQTNQYSVTAIATCCTQNYNTKPTSDNAAVQLMEPTSKPTIAPTFKQRLYTHYYGPNGTTTNTLSIDPDERDFFHNENSDEFLPLAGISEWGIFQIYSAKLAKDYKWFIPYQGILIGKYSVWDKKKRMEKYGDDDYSLELGNLNFQQRRQCSSFQLDIINGVMDYINGFDVYYTNMTVFGLTFYTAFGRKYSCPDNELFVDDSKTNPKVVPMAGNNEQVLDNTYYEMTNISIRNVFENNSTHGVYKLGGWRGTYQPREVYPAVVRKLYASISFSFVFDGTVNTLFPTETITTPSPTTLPPQNTSKETLICQSKFDVNEVTCEIPNDDIATNGGTQTMTGCNGYSVEGQVISAYIIDNSTSKIAKCVVKTSNDKPAAAIATCCYFEPPIVRDWKVFVLTSIIGGVIFVIIFIIISILLFFKIKNQHFFDPADVDDDSLIDRVIENVGSDVAQGIVGKFRVSADDLKQMQEQLEQRPSDSVGLQDDFDHENN